MNSHDSIIKNHYFHLMKSLSKSESQSKFTEGIASVSLFWISMIALQRTAGIVNMHAGLPLPLSSTYGLMIVSTSHYICSQFAPLFNNLVWNQKVNSKEIKPKVFIKSCFLNLVFFLLIERNFFLTALPSSIISRGAYARKIGSLIATGEVATSKQRSIIQNFGKKFGCHQCGSKKSFGAGKVFIADHIPPTYFVNKAMKSIWNKVFRLKQRLYPQCFKCFSIQGHHVKSSSHFMIYHQRLRLVHFSPVVSSIAVIMDCCNIIIDPIEIRLNKVLEKVEKLLDY